MYSKPSLSLFRSAYEYFSVLYLSFSIHHHILKLLVRRRQWLLHQLLPRKLFFFEFVKSWWFHIVFFYVMKTWIVSSRGFGNYSTERLLAEIRYMLALLFLHSLCFISNTVNEGLVSHFLKFHSRCLALLSCCLFSS